MPGLHPNSIGLATFNRPAKQFRPLQQADAGIGPHQPLVGGPIVQPQWEHRLLPARIARAKSIHCNALSDNLAGNMAHGGAAGAIDIGGKWSGESVTLCVHDDIFLDVDPSVQRTP